MCSWLTSPSWFRIQVLVSRQPLHTLHWTGGWEYNRFPSVRPPLLDTIFENFLNNSGAKKNKKKKSCNTKEGFGVCEANLASLANNVHGTSATQKSLFLLEDTGHQQLTSQNATYSFAKVRGITKYGTLDPIFLLTYLGCMCAAFLHHANYVPNLHKEFRNWHIMPLKSRQLIHSG